MDFDRTAKDVSRHVIKASVVDQHAARSVQPVDRDDSGGISIRPLRSTQILPMTGAPRPQTTATTPETDSLMLMIDKEPHVLKKVLFAVVASATLFHADGLWAQAQAPGARRQWYLPWARGRRRAQDRPRAREQALRP